MFGNELHKIEEYTHRGYGGSTHTGSNISKVPPELVKEIKEMLAKEGKDVPVKKEDNK